MKTIMTLTIATVALMTVANSTRGQVVSSAAPRPAANKAPEGQPGVGPYQNSLARSSRVQDSVPPVVIGFGSNAAAALQNMDEDLAIMTRVLDRALEKGLGEDAPPTKLGVRLYYTAGSRSVRTLYLEGYGALFMIKVNFPLTGLERGQAKGPEKPADSEWEKARRELHQEGGPAEGTRWYSSGPAFDAAQVDGLKEVLVQALKNASHLRALKSDEFVSISVFGTAPGYRRLDQNAFGTRQTTSARRPEESDEAQVGRTVSVLTAAGPYRPDDGAGTVLTLRVKKADIDAFAEGKLNMEAFRAKLTSHAYMGTGHDISSVNSWIHESGSTSTYPRR